MDTPAVEKARRLIRQHEGCELLPYTDTVGKLTIGYGRNLTDRGITPHEAEVFLTTDITIAHADARDLAGTAWERLTLNRQAVLIDMAFNLGKRRLKRFHKMWAAIFAGDYAEAASEMLNSLWAFQVGNRAFTLSTLMRDG